MLTAKEKLMIRGCYAKWMAWRVAGVTPTSLNPSLSGTEAEVRGCPHEEGRPRLPPGNWRCARIAAPDTACVPGEHVFAYQ